MRREEELERIEDFVLRTREFSTLDLMWGWRAFGCLLGLFALSLTRGFRFAIDIRRHGRDQIQESRRIR
jgi:hypothetical protein